MFDNFYGNVAYAIAWVLFAVLTWTMFGGYFFDCTHHWYK